MGLRPTDDQLGMAATEAFLQNWTHNATLASTQA
jgi:hypothetical protein